MVLNDTLNHISDISWRSVLLVEETGEPGENHWPVAINWHTLLHKAVSITPRHERYSNSQLYGWYTLIAQVVVNSTNMWSRPRQPLFINGKK